MLSFNFQILSFLLFLKQLLKVISHNTSLWSLTDVSKISIYLQFLTQWLKNCHVIMNDFITFLNRSYKPIFFHLLKKKNFFFSISNIYKTFFFFPFPFLFYLFIYFILFYFILFLKNMRNYFLIHVLLFYFIIFIWKIRKIYVIYFVI